MSLTSGRNILRKLTSRPDTIYCPSTDVGKTKTFYGKLSDWELEDMDMGDMTYTIGQRLVIREATVLRLADLLATLSEELRKLA